jgi:outer membrane protein assembly factor BamB
MKKQTNQTTQPRAWWEPAPKGVAIVSGTFCVIVAALLLYNYYVSVAGLPEKEPIYSAELMEKKALLTNDPLNEEITSEVRRLDLELRHTYFQRKAFSQRGAYILLAGFLIFLYSTKKTLAASKVPFRPKPKKADIDFETVSMQQARKSLVVMGCIVTGCLLAFSTASTVTLQTSESDEMAAAPPPSFPTQEEMQKNWPRFQGAGGAGISTHANIPTMWDADSGEGIVWKSEIPLPGNNSPIAWGDRVFLSGADKENKEVFCYSVQTGELLWRGAVNNVPGTSGESIDVMEDTGYAASTMACDGTRVYAIFADGILAAFDFNGNRVWAKSLGIPDSIYNFATSLTTYKHQVIIQYDQGTEDDDLSALIAINGETGEVLWKQTRPVANAWTTPIVIDTGTEKQIITCSEPWVIGNNADTGDEIWRANLLGTDVAPSPIYADGIVYAIQPNEAMFAINVTGKGDVTETHLVWETDCPAPEISCPVTNGEYIFLLASMGLLGCYDVKTGELVWEHEINDNFLASPVLVGEWLYLVSESGKTYRVKAAKEVETAEAIPFINEWLKASPAFLDNHIFIRGEEYLYCIGN